MITFCVILRINLDFLLLLWVDAAIKFYDFACFGFETTPRVVCFVYSSREWPRLQCPDFENLERKLLQSEEIISTMFFFVKTLLISVLHLNTRPPTFPTGHNLACLEFRVRSEKSSVLTLKLTSTCSKFFNKRTLAEICC